MISKIILITLFAIIGIQARKIYLDTNWGDSDPNDDYSHNNWYRSNNNNWKTSNRFSAQSNLLDYHGDAKAQQANWIRGAIKLARAAFTEEAIRNLFNYIPRGMLIAPVSEFTTQEGHVGIFEQIFGTTEFTINRTKSSTKSWKRRKNKT